VESHFSGDRIGEAVVDEGVRPRFRILSLDGEGIRGAFSAACLAEIERKLSRPIVECFDLIAGTSTGGIIAMGLALGVRAEKIEQFYLKYGELIFRRRPPRCLPLWKRPFLGPIFWLARAVSY
jgi:patatin-like phospholipase/acyl hydrolase